MEPSEILRDVIALLGVPLILWGFYTISQLKETVAELRVTLKEMRDGIRDAERKQDESLTELYNQTRTLGERIARVESPAK